MSTPLDIEPILRPILVKQDTIDEAASPRGGNLKAVSIASPEISPTLTAVDHQTTKQFSAGLARRLSGRPSVKQWNSNTDEITTPMVAPEMDKRQHTHEKLLSQVAQWVQAEKAKRAARRATAAKPHDPSRPPTNTRSRNSSESSDSSTMSLERLQRILDDSMEPSPYGIDGPLSQNINSSSRGSVNSPTLGPRRPSMGIGHGGRRRSSKLGSGKQDRNNSSDTEYQDGDAMVPSCEVALDNSKTLSYSSGAVNATDRAEKDAKAWASFKLEILKITHTLRLKGWRKVPFERSNEIKVERLSGALTNAVYMVSLSTPASSVREVTAVNRTPSTTLPKPPPKLLLRIYGPQVEHLIDRENELGILKRLARKKIGPRLLGTFINGRFEEYFESTTLTSQDLRVPDTSKQIAKRMRELHDGVELLDREREEGPFVWRNWDKWVERCGKVCAHLDARVGPDQNYVCAVEWKTFRDMVDKYRSWLDTFYGGHTQLQDKLVFAHNDTQYGNILRLVPMTSESPLLLPANSHKQLIVIDFEYASANTPGLEFANHFTEWCYNYHDASGSHKCRTENYPTPNEQRNFIKSYVNHRPQFNARASATPKLGPRDASLASIKDFMLDSRTPGMNTTNSNYDAEETSRLKAINDEVEFLVKESRLWRVANSAQWVAWGIVQAKVPGMVEDEEPSTESKCEHQHEDKRPEGLVAEVIAHDGTEADIREAQRREEADGEDEFDYLAYARERALFFWGDCVELGLIKEDELPAAIRSELKIVQH